MQQGTFFAMRSQSEVPTDQLDTVSCSVTDCMQRQAATSAGEGAHILYQTMHHSIVVTYTNLTPSDLSIISQPGHKRLSHDSSMFTNVCKH